MERGALMRSIMWKGSYHGKGTHGEGSYMRHVL